jgi:crossover junction endodeoxyribonuclease RuvC
MTRIVGIDPGLNGSIAMIDSEDWTLSVFDMPKEPGRGSKNAVSPTGTAQLLNRLAPEYVFIEDVHSSPQMGVTSAFNFGRSLGVVLGASATTAILTLVRPQEWKAKTKTPADKNQARRRAQQLFPCAYDIFSRVKDDGRAEASILCFYGLLSLKLMPPKPLTLKEIPS